MVLGPARIIRDHRSEMTYIGPLREILSRSYRARRSTLGEWSCCLGSSLFRSGWRVNGRGQ